MSTRAVLKTSKLLSFLLRHDPGSIGLTLDGAGWADIEALIRHATAAGHRIDRDLIERAVRENDKKRFGLSPDGLRIRARQGHSFPVDLGLEPRTPPPVLYHGTARRFLDSILESGLEKRSRTHVHLSSRIETAREVGRRHGSPVILKVAADAMFDRGHAFFFSENEVWLTDHVPPRFLSLVEASRGGASLLRR